MKKVVIATRRKRKMAHFIMYASCPRGRMVSDDALF
jgi:hypothetical protein